MTTGIYAKRAKDVMSRDLVTINADDTVHSALEIMAENKVAMLPVVDPHGRCVGVLSISDLVEVTRDVDAGLSELEETAGPLWGPYLDRLSLHIGHQNVVELMSDTVITVGPDALLFEAASRMLREQVHHLPIVDAQQRLLGIVSTTDIVAAFVDGAPLPTK